jgi:hypothetical protein
VRDAKGNVIPPPPPPPPEASRIQRWIKAAEENNDIADILVFAGRANNWFDIYKTVELAEKMAGGQAKLRGLLGECRRDYERMRNTANSYRHARYNNPPPILTTLEEARSLVTHIVKTVLDRQPLANPD